MLPCHAHVYMTKLLGRGSELSGEAEAAVPERGPFGPGPETRFRTPDDGLGWVGPYFDQERGMAWNGMERLFLNESET